MIKAVVFDFDGTLFHFVLDYVGMRDAVRNVVLEGGCPVSLFKEEDRIRDYVNKMLEFAETKGWSATKVAEVMSGITSTMDKYEWESAQKNSPVHGAMDVLRSLRAMRLKIGLLTNNNRRSISYLIKKYGFQNLLDVIVTRDDLGDFNNLKPSPVGLNRILNKLRVLPHETIYVGDSVVDVRTALSVGATPVFVTTGYSRAEEVKKVSPTVPIIDQLERLLDYVKEKRGVP